MSTRNDVYDQVRLANPIPTVGDVTDRDLAAVRSAVELGMSPTPSPTAPIPPRPASPKGRRFGWAVGLATAALVLLLVGGVGWLVRSDDAETGDTPPTSTSLVTSSVTQPPPEQTTWVNPAGGGVGITLDPIRLPTAAGVYRIEVNARAEWGSQLEPFNTIWLCPQLRGAVVPDIAVPIGERCDRVAGTELAHLEKPSERLESTEIVVEVDARTIEDGGLVIAISGEGESWAATALLEVSDRPAWNPAPGAEAPAWWILEGTGDAIVDCPRCGTGWVLEISHDGTEQFTIVARDADGRPVPGPRWVTDAGVVVGYRDLPVAPGAEISDESAAVVLDAKGAYEGRIRFWPEEEAGIDVLDVTADGSWRIVARMSSVTWGPPMWVGSDQVLSHTLSGSWDDIVWWDSPICDVDRLTATYLGTGRFLVRGFGAFGYSATLFDEDGPGTYEVTAGFQAPLQPGHCDGAGNHLEIRSSGPWTLTIHPPPS